jgi:hypothetical protein
LEKAHIASRYLPRGYAKEEAEALVKPCKRGLRYEGCVGKLIKRAGIVRSWKEYMSGIVKAMRTF